MTEISSTDRAAFKRRRSAALGSVVGTSLEFYDFAIYGLAAALVFGPVFFPTASPTTALLASFATFGVGFLARPLGGVLFGHLGDRIGRKNILATTLLMMGGATVAIGCLPGFATIGYWAPALLVALRLLQGLAFGGEWGGAVLMAAEHADPKRRGLFASLPQLGFAIGIILGNLTFLMVGLLGKDALQDWAWRIPFWAGGLLMIVGIVIRSKVSESPAFERIEARNEVTKFPVIEVLRLFPREILLSAGIVGSVSMAAYMMIAYSVSFLKADGVASWLPLTGIMVASAAHLVVIPYAGALSDRFGRRPVFITGALSLAVLTLFFFPAIGSGIGVLIILVYVVNYGIVFAFVQAVYPSLLSESFDARVGYSGISLGCQLGNILGGLTPFLATLIVAATGTPVFLSVIISAALVLGAVCATVLVGLQTKRAHREALRGTEGPTRVGVSMSTLP